MALVEFVVRAADTNLLEVLLHLPNRAGALRTIATLIPLFWTVNLTVIRRVVSLAISALIFSSVAGSKFITRFMAGGQQPLELRH